MRKETTSIPRFVGVSIIFVFLVFILTGGEPAFCAVTAQKQPVREVALNGGINKILPVLEDKIHDQKLLEKSKEKIYLMGDREIRLVAALCEKISGEGETVSSDIAFLLVTAIIVLS
jgi:hypothetical protein